MNTFYTGVLATLVALVLFSCTQVTVPLDSSERKLPNGDVATAEEAAILDGLKEQVLAIDSEIAQSRSVGDSELVTKAKFEAYRELLISKFGKNWKRYVSVRVASVTTNADTGEQIGSTASHEVDPDTLLGASSRSIAPLARHSYQSGTTSYGYLNEVVSCARYSWWWNYYNIAKQSYTGPTGSPYTCISMSLTLTESL